MVINECKLSTMEQYSPTEIITKDVACGEGFKSYLLNMMPGQETPARHHANKTVMLIPQRGQATLFTEDQSELVVVAGSIYTDHRGMAFGLRNTSQEPFQLLVILIAASSD
jgi:mannose-6-phosphate isomerase-like protein (cupin superfamily)